MAEVDTNVAVIGQPKYVYHNAVVDITSVLVGTPDVVFASRKIIGNKGVVSIQMIESNGIQALVQPWVSMDGTNWKEVKYSAVQNHWIIGANDNDFIYFDTYLRFKYIKVTAYVAAGTAKLIGHMLII